MQLSAKDKSKRGEKAKEVSKFTGFDSSGTNSDSRADETK